MELEINKTLKISKDQKKIFLDKIDRKELYGCIPLLRIPKLQIFFYFLKKVYFFKIKKFVNSNFTNFKI